MPSEIDSYQHIENIYAGKMSRVNTAFDTQGRKVVVKTYNFDNRSLSETENLKHGEVVRKGFALRKQHPDISNDVLVYPHIGEVPQVAYYYIEGVSSEDDVDEIERSTRNQSLECIKRKINTARRFIHETMSVLEELIKRNLAHRDVKGENVVLRNGGGVTLLDYDFLTKVDASNHTIAWGTTYYMSPEGASFKLSPTMDVFSLGITAVDLYISRIADIAGLDYSSVERVLLNKRQKGSKVSDPSVRKRLLNLDDFPEEVRADVHGVICFLLEALNNDPSARPKTAEETRQLLSMTPNISMI